MTTVFVAGANGQTGRRIVSKLVEAGYDVRGLVRKEDHLRDLESAGAKGYLGDLSGVFTGGMKGADIVICAAGAGASGDPEHVDHVGTVRLIEQSVLEQIPRFVLISSMGTKDPDAMPSSLKPFLMPNARLRPSWRKAG
jgi:uncharacterized protein YbjT (DUF2867 family)